MTHKSSPFLRVQLTNSEGVTLSRLNDVIEGEVFETGASDLKIELSCSECGPAEALFYIEIEDGSPLSFSCQANFRGPIVRLKETVIDFGLAKVNTNHHRVITIENECPIPASLIIKNFKNKSMTFENALNGESFEINTSVVNESRLSVASQGSLVVGRPVKTVGGNVIKLDNCSFELAPRSKMNISIDLDCLKPESVEEYFEIMVKDASSLFV